MGVIFFLLYARKHESNLPTNNGTTVGKHLHNDIQKTIDLLSESLTHSCFISLFCDSMVWFIIWKCLFFTNGVFELWLNPVSSYVSFVRMRNINMSQKVLSMLVFLENSIAPDFAQKQVFQPNKWFKKVWS